MASRRIGQPERQMDRFFKELGAKRAEKRKKTAESLRNFVEHEVRDMTSEQAAKFLNECTGRVVDMVNSAVLPEKLGGICAIDTLVDLKCESNETMIIRFANCFRLLFEQSASHDDSVVLELASKALGHLARAGGALTVDIVEFQVTSSLEWLRERRNEKRRLAAVLVLKELARNTPTLFNVYVNQFLDHIWVALRDPKTQIREAAIEAMRECLIDMAKRASRWKLECYFKVFREAQLGFQAKRDSVYSIHGSLLTIGELLNNTGEFMLSRFKEACDTILRYKDHKNEDIARTVISLLPRLAALCPEAFVRSYLQDCLEHTVRQTKTSNRHTAFIALGEVAMVVGVHMQTSLRVIMDTVREGLTPKLAKTDKKNKHFSYAALTCVGMLAKALGPQLLPYLDQVVDQMFCTGLSPALIDALSDLTANIPKLLPSTQERLLDVITAILSGVYVNASELKITGDKAGLYGSIGAQGSAGYKGRIGPIYQDPPRASGLPPRRVIRLQDGKKKSKKGGEPVGGSVDVNLLVLGLQTLGSFDFASQAFRLISLVRDSVLFYLSDNTSLTIRREAVAACTAVIPRIADKIKHSHAHTTKIIFHLLQRLTLVAIADPVSSMRVTVLSSLDVRLDKYLSQEKILQTLCLALNDEVFAVREQAITLLGRLSSQNPALILPALRKSLIQLLMELKQFNVHTIDVEESSKLLGHLISSSPQLIKPYVAPILQVLAPKLTGITTEQGEGGEGALKGLEGTVGRSHEGVAAYVLETLGKLSTICGEDMRRYLDGLIPLIIDTLQDSSKSSKVKRLVALRTLTQLVSSTGYVITPCEKYPKLLPTVLAILKGERSKDLRIEVLKVLGNIGALDPFRFKRNQTDLANLQKKQHGEKLMKAEGKKGNRSGSELGGQDDLGQAALEETPFDSDSQAKVGGGALYPDPQLLAQSPDEYYPTVAIAALMQVLSDAGLVQHHHMVLKAVMFIFRSMGSKCVPFLAKVIPIFLREMHRCEEPLREAFFQELCAIVSIVNEKIRPFLNSIFALVKEFWRQDDPGALPGVGAATATTSTQLKVILTLCEEIAKSLPQEFKSYLPQLVPNVLKVLQSERFASKGDPTPSVLRAVRVWGEAGGLGDYLYVLIPALLRVAEHDEAPVKEIRRVAVQTLLQLLTVHHVKDHASRILHACSRLLAEPFPELHTPTLQICAVLVRQLGVGFLVFEPGIRKVYATAGDKYFSEVSMPAFHKYKVLLAELISQVVKMQGDRRRQAARFAPSARSHIVNNYGVPSHSLMGGGGNGAVGGGTDENITLASDAMMELLGGTPAAGGAGASGSSGGGDDMVGQEEELQHALSQFGLEAGREGGWGGKPELGYAWLAFQGAKVELGADVDDLRRSKQPKASEQDQGTGQVAKKLHVAQQNLMKAWAASHRSTAEDWVVWIRGFSIELLKESPSSALRACSALAHKYPPLAQELFNAAFLSCWSELFDQFQDDLIHSLETSFSSKTIPPEIVQVLLNLAQFMEHHDKALPIDIRTLGNLAERCHAYAKALHYKETEFHTSPSSTIEALISINNKLGHQQAARGILTFAQKHHRVELKESWYFKLERWADALEAYERKQLDQPGSADIALSRMRCLRALGEWRRLAKLGKDVWSRGEEASRRQIAPLLADAACNLRRWGSLEQYIGSIEEGTQKGCFYRAVLAVHRDQFAVAKRYIARSLELVDADVTALVGESYARAYKAIIKVQQLVELEEIISFKRGGRRYNQVELTYSAQQRV